MATVERSTTRDAVIVIPGIMGSELVDAATGTPLWGLADVGWYLRAWLSGSGLDNLRVTDEERAGTARRIRPTRLLRFPAFAPMLRGFEPYTALIQGLRQVVPDPAAIAPFPYDWRLPAVHNARHLADVAERHLRFWRAHRHGSRSARLILVAHSLGGLVTRYFSAVLGGRHDVRLIITFGTPFRGSVKAAQILATGRGAPVPLPRRRLRHLVSTMPGLHDLLPTYPCVADGTVARRLTAADVADLGGDRELAAAAARLHDQLSGADEAPLRTVVGVEQPTVQSISLHAGVVTPQQWVYLRDPETGEIKTENRRGDGTVHRDNAAGGVEPFYLSQTHGAIAVTPEAIRHVCAVITERALGDWLGPPPLMGLDIPDTVTAGLPFPVMVRPTADPAAVTCTISHAFGNNLVETCPLGEHEEGLSGSVTLHEPGLYRVAVQEQAFSPVTQLVMVSAPGGGQDDE